MHILIRKSILACLFLFSVLCNAYASENFSSQDDSLGIVVTQNSTFLMPGQELEIKVFATCNSKNKINKINIGGMGIPLNKEGIATLKMTGGSIGLHEIPVAVSFKNSSGRILEKSHTVRYTVGQANASVALDKMNILYIGFENPVTVAATGGTDDKVTVSISGGGMITKVGKGKYLVRVTTLSDNCIISVAVDGKMAGTSQFRVRNIPQPTGHIGGVVSGDSVLLNSFINQAGISAGYSGFGIDVNYSVVSHTLIINNDNNIKTFNVQGPAFTTEVRQFLIKNLKPGSIVTVGNLLAIAPVGGSMKLLPLVYFIK
jgi:gliding motility-associated protein GldM